MTSKHYDWKSEYELGINALDMQHHFFLDLINRLTEELGRADNVAYQADLINELNAYARFHFISEENIMAQAGYPELEEHRKHHHALLDQLGSRELALEMSDSEIEVEEILEFLTHWFLQHTMIEDKLFANYIQNKPVG